MERIRNGLAALPPESRALLELSLRRGVSDVDIARLLDVELEGVDDRRELALDGLASELGLGSRAEVDELRATLPDLPRDLWVAQLAPLDGGEPPARPEPVPAPAEPEAPRGRAGGRGATWALLGVLAIVVVAAVIALTSGGDSGSGEPATPASEAASPSSAARSAALAPLAGEKVSGRATLRGGVLRLRLSGLPAPGAGSYQAWLYNNLADARSLGRVHAGRLTAKLPAAAHRYRFVDVSREPADGNPNHSGASVVRVRLAGLR